MKIEILIYNNKSRIIAGRDILYKIQQLTKIRAKNYFWSPLYRKRQWDGYIKYVSEATGYFSTGLLSQIVDVIEAEYKTKVVLKDLRNHIKLRKNEVVELGGLELRDEYQTKSRDSLIFNKYRNIPFQRGILNDTTNAGKNLISAAIFKSFRNAKGIFLVDSIDIYEQAVEELKELLGDDKVGEVSSKKINIKNLTVCMVQSLNIKLKKNLEIKNWLCNIDIVIVDEADLLIGRKDCKGILANCHDAPIRISLTGTAGLSKDENKNQELLGFFGPIIHTTTNLDMVNWGFSAKPKIKTFVGNLEYLDSDSYQIEYDLGITNNKKRHKRIWKRVQKNIDKNRIPILILFKYHKHGYNLLKYCPKEIQNLYKIKLVHHETKNRKFIFDEFKKGRIDILLSSMIIRRGKNLPSIQCLINAAGGDSEANVRQILGRALRKHKNKKSVVLEEAFDMGKYLRRHSKHRVTFYQKDGWDVKDNHSEKIKKLLKINRI